MGVFIGLDVSLSKTAVYVVARDGAVLWHLNARRISGSRSGDVPIERRGRDAEAVRDLRHPDVRVGEQDRPVRDQWP
jgi:hypothetical protein